MVADVQLEVWMDDLNFEASSAGPLYLDHERQAGLKLAWAVSLLCGVVAYHLRCQIATDKTAAVASSDAVLQYTNKCLKVFGEEPLGEKEVPTNLGVDHKAARKRKQGKRALPKRAGRFAQASRRSRRLQWARSRVTEGKARMAKIATSGLLPALGYGSRVWSMTGPELRAARRMRVLESRPVSHRLLTVVVQMDGVETAATVVHAPWNGDEAAPQF